MINYRKRTINDIKYKIGGHCFRTIEEIAERYIVSKKTVKLWIDRGLPAPDGRVIEKIFYKQSRPLE